MRIAFQGEMGAFSEAMAGKLFPGAEVVPCKSFKDVFGSVESGKSDAGVIPVENSLTGRVSEPTALLMKSGLRASGEGMLKIVHCLIAQKGVKAESLERVYAHPEALAQCRSFTSSSKTQFISWYDGAAAAEIVEKDARAGLIAGERVADIYGLSVLKRGVQDNAENVTRFLVISKGDPKPTGKDKTSLVFSVKHEPGSLVRALEAFAVNGVNLTRLESAPSREKLWEYVFLADFEGHAEGEDQSAAIRALKRNAASVKILGSYPQGEMFG